MSPNHEGATEALATFAAGLRYEDLPSDVRHQGKRIILDTLACVIAAQPYEAATIVQDVLVTMGGSGQVSVLGTPRRTSASSAAFINAELANLLDLDDNLLNHTHFANTAATVPFALGEDRGASGKDVIRAVVAAYEVSSRLTLAFNPVVDLIGTWPNHELRRRDAYGMGFSTIGAAAGAGNICGLSPRQMQHAFGVAGYSAPVPANGKHARNPYLHMKKYAAYGQIASNAITAALLAEAGFTADTEVLDGDYGFWRMSGNDHCNWDVLSGGLGSQWWSLETTFKYYPVCTWDRQPVQAVQQLLARNPVPVESIQSIEIAVHPAAARDGLWLKTDPRTHLETQMSHPYALAMAILGVPGPDWQKPETFTRADARALMDKMTVVPDAEGERAYYDQLSHGIRRVRRSPASVTIVADSGTYRESADYAKGDPYTEETRLTDEELVEKFVHYGLETADKGDLERAARAILTLDEFDDVGTVARLMSYPQRAGAKIPSRVDET